MELKGGSSGFHTTLWSVVLRAGEGEGLPKQAALDQLCRLYWKPLFVYSLRHGRKVEDAEDLTQAFFAHLLARDTLRVADPARGRFRAFLLTSFKHFIASEWDRQRALKRGGGTAHLSFDVDFKKAVGFAASGELTPECAFDRQWAEDLVERATGLLREEMARSGKAAWFDLIAGPQSGAPYAEVAAALETSEEAVKSFAKRTRRRFRELLDREIADTVGSPEEAAREMVYLVELLRG